MDGEAAHVPLQWVSAVLKEAVEKLGDPKVFVLSVLGLQSTGKSTMLNTAFGLQFNVRAGRCTRGAFMQLLPVDEKLRRQTNCSYVLVVDTEGLRAPELDRLKAQNHDNELATFVIGLANMTLINIYGEVAGDMDDILQTSVHAFLRMTQVRYNPSCQFVHQNAGANIISEVGRAKFMQRLNQFTIDAAKEENCEGQYKSFNDVIKFDDQTDVHCFPGLWKDDPPMAPVSQGYSHSAQMLKQHFIDIVCKRSRTDTSKEITGNLSSFQVQVEDLWKALLKENFVFSFKNTLEIIAYNSLETAYSKWYWKFQEGMLKWEQITENAITAAPTAYVPDLIKLKCETLQAYWSQELYEPIKLEMKDFFNGEKSEILAQWKAKFEIRFDERAKVLKSRAEKHCARLGKSREVVSKIKQARENYARIIKEEVRQHILSIKKEQEELKKSMQNCKLESNQLKKMLGRKLFTPESVRRYKEQGIITEDKVREINLIIQQCGDQLTEDTLDVIMVGGVLRADEVEKILKEGQTEGELRERFDEIWIELVDQLPLVLEESIDVETEVEKTLIEFVGAQHGSLFITKLKEKDSLRDWGTCLEFIPEEKKHYNIIKSMLTKARHYIFRGTHTVDNYQDQALEITKKVFSLASQYLQEITKKRTDFNTGFTLQVLRQVDEAITEESASVKDLTLTPEYRQEVYLTVCGYAIPEFQKMAESFKEQNDPRHYLKKHVKGPLFSEFKNQFYQTEAKEAIATTLCAYLKEPIKVQVGKRLGAKMVGNMRNSRHYFSSKMALKVKVLTDLHKKNEFNDYMAYVQDVKTYLKNQIEYYTMQYCDEKVPGERNSRLQVSVKAEITKLLGVIENTVNEVNETDICKWLSTFCNDERLRSELGVNLEAGELLRGCEKLNLQDFKSHIIQVGLNDLKKELHASFDSIKYKMVNWKDKPDELLQDLVGCTEQCPFCGEQCDLLQPNHVDDGHKHRVAVHRPGCLRGWHTIKDDVLMVEFCPSEVAGRRQFRILGTKSFHPYRDYQKIYPQWSIPPDITSEGSKYWMLFVGKYKDEIAERFNLKPPPVPSSWAQYTWYDVAKHLQSVYNL